MSFVVKSDANLPRSFLSHPDAHPSPADDPRFASFLTVDVRPVPAPAPALATVSDDAPQHDRQGVPTQPLLLPHAAAVAAAAAADMEEEGEAKPTVRVLPVNILLEFTTNKRQQSPEAVGQEQQNENGRGSESASGEPYLATLDGHFTFPLFASYPPASASPHAAVAAGGGSGSAGTGTGSGHGGGAPVAFPESAEALPAPFVTVWSQGVQRSCFPAAASASGYYGSGLGSERHQRQREEEEGEMVTLSVHLQVGRFV